MINLASKWQKIKSELDSLNLFYSAITGRSDARNGFYRMGFEDFIHIKLKGREVSDNPRPDFVLLKDEYMCIVEVKSGKNIDDRHYNQSQRNSSFSIEGLRDYFREYHNKTVEIREFDSLFVYYEETLKECMEHENCKENLENIMEDSIVLSQKRGDKLTYWEENGPVSHSQLDRALEEGIGLDEAPKKEIKIVDDPELENVVYYLTRKLLDHLKEEKEIILSHRDAYDLIPNHISNCSLDRVRNALETMRELDAATLKQGTNNQYRVKKEDVGKLMDIPTILMNKDAEEILDMEEGSIEDFEDKDSN